MSATAMIDVTIGLILMYLVLSLVGTSINEFLATVAGMRAATLRKSLAKMVDNDALRQVFYGHGLIAGSSPKPEAHPSYLSGTTFALALLDSLDPKKTLPGIADLQTTAESLPTSNVRDIVLANIATAKGDIDKLRTGLADSFDQAMERVSGTYKRQLKWISLVVGFLLALALNADSIAVGQALWSDSSLRNQMAKVAEQALAAGSNGAVATLSEPDVKAIVRKIREAETALRPLPIGWDQPDMSNLTNALFVARKLAGLLLTAAALMVGAPFWFDLLSKFVNLRGTGDKPALTRP